MKSKSMRNSLVAASILLGLFSCDAREKQNPASSESTVTLAPRLTMASGASSKVIAVDSVLIQITAGGKTYFKGAAFDRHFIQIDGIPVNTRWTMSVSGLHKAADGMHWPIWWHGVDSGTTSTVPGTVEWPSVKVAVSDTTTSLLAGPGVPVRDTTTLPHGTTTDVVRFQVPVTDSVYRNDIPVVPSQVAAGYATYAIDVPVPSSQRIKLVTAVGNVTLDTFHFAASSDVTTDPAAPTIKITSPDSAISHTNQFSVVVDASVQSNSGVDSVVAWTGLVRKVLRSGPPWTTTLSLSPGQNSIVDSVYAKNGKTASASIIVHAPKNSHDSVAPVMVRRSPAIQSDSVPWTTTAIQLVWKVHDVDGKVLSAGLRSLPNTQAAPGPDSLWSSLQPLKRGRNVFVFVAKDSAGNSDSDSVVVVRRASPQGPSMTRSSGTGERLLPSGTKIVNLGWSVSDTDELVSLTVNGAADGSPLNGTTVSVNGSARRATVAAAMNLSTDSILVRLVATDSSGNVSRDSFLVRVAQTPQASRVKPVEDTLSLPWDSSAIHLDWNVARTRGLSEVSLFANGAPTPFNIVGTSYSAAPNLQVGSNRLVLVVCDSVGDTLKDTVMVERRSDPFHPEVNWLGKSSRIDTVPYKTTSYSAMWNVTGKNTTPTVTVERNSPSAGGVLQQSGSLFTFKANLRVWAPGYDTVFHLVAVGAPGDTTYDSVRVVVAADTNHPVVALAGGSRDTVVTRNTPSCIASWTISDPTLMAVTMNNAALPMTGSGTYSKAIALAGDTTWIFLAAKDSSGFVKRDSIRVRRLAPPSISGAGDTLTVSVRTQLGANLADARLSYSTNKSNWTAYPSGGVVVSTSQMLYAKDSVGPVVVVDSARFLFAPVISGTAPNVTVSASGDAVVEDSLSTEAGWNPSGTRTATIALNSSARVYARARLRNAVSKVVQLPFAVAPALNTPSGTYSRGVTVTVADPGADSILASSNGTSWSRVSGGRYDVSASGTYQFRSMLGGQISSYTSRVWAISHDTSLRSGEIRIGSRIQPITLNGAVGATDSLPAGTLSAVLSFAPSDSLATVLVNGAASGQVILFNDTATARITVVNGTSFGYFTVRLDAKRGVYFTDARDGRIYPKVTIGGQTWMARNLNFRSSFLGSDTTGLCYGYSVDSCQKYGRLYTWAMINGLPSFCDSVSCADSLSEPRRGICPVGWHLPTFSDWRTFEANVGDNSIGIKTVGWGGGDNSLGFAASGGGAYNQGSFNESTYSSYFWTTDELTELEGVFGYIRENDVVRHISYTKTAALSLRCIAD